MFSRFVGMKVNKNLCKTYALLRHNSTQSSTKLTTIEVDPKTAIATLTLQRLPANALNVALLQQMKQDVKDIEEQKCRGIVLTSASERIFSAGLDLITVYQAEEAHLSELWQSLQNMWLAFFSTALPTAALINGHATAGGCLLALCCDYRVMLPNFIIGMNETKAGVAVPSWVMDSYVNVIPRRMAERDLIEGTLYRSEEALKRGLIDDLVATKAEALAKCMIYLTGAKTDAERMARSETKLQFRSQIISAFHKERHEDNKLFVQGIQRPEVQAFLGEYVKSFKKKSKK